MSHQISLNIRFLIWKRKKPARAGWVRWLSTHTELPESWCDDLLRERIDDSAVGPKNLQELARAFDVAEEDLRFADLPRQGGDIASENVKFLFGTLAHGGKRASAAELGIDPTTISRWLNGTSKPQRPALLQLANLFGLSPGTDLQSMPIFLSIEPIAREERNRWIEQRVRALGSREFAELYPAMRKLLTEK